MLASGSAVLDAYFCEFGSTSTPSASAPLSMSLSSHCLRRSFITTLSREGEGCTIGRVPKKKKSWKAARASATRRGGGGCRGEGKESGRPPWRTPVALPLTYSPDRPLPLTGAPSPPGSRARSVHTCAKPASSSSCLSSRARRGASKREDPRGRPGGVTNCLAAPPLALMAPPLAAPTPACLAIDRGAGTLKPEHKISDGTEK